jgi:hypothetical protein
MEKQQALCYHLHLLHGKSLRKAVPSKNIYAAVDSRTAAPKSFIGG